MKTQTPLRSLLSIVLAILLAFGGSLSAFAAPNDSADSPVSMIVDHSVYGWVTTAAAANSDGTVSVSIMPAGKSATEKYTSALSYNYITNAMTNITYTNVITSRVGNGVFAEICFNADDEVIDIRRVIGSGLLFDTAEFGGDLTAVGSEVKTRGAEYTDRYFRFNNDPTGPTGIMTGDSGRMVASGWVLDKEDGKITIGDGNLVTEVFIDEYDVAADVKVYQVANSGYASTEKTFADVPVTATGTGKYEGTIYNTANRQYAVVVFDEDYTQYGDGAKITEIYYFASNVTFGNNGRIPQSVPISSSYSEADQGSPGPGGTSSWLTSAKPITVVDDKLWVIGDIEVFNYLFKGDDELIMYDTGRTADGYQYWKNIQKVGQNPRKLTRILTSHGHSDHYGAAFDGWEMVVRSGGAPKVFETYEDTFGYDIYGFPNVGGSLSDRPFMSIITDWTKMDEWLELSEGLAMYPILAPGHTQGVSSAIFQVTVGSTMENARLNSVYNEESEEWDPVLTDYNEGDEIYFTYMGGYGINGLAGLSSGYRRNAFVSSLRYLQSVVPSTPTITGKRPDGIYNLPQHTNQFPYLEAANTQELYNEKNDTDLPFLSFLQEGNEEVINFAEKRASAILYSSYAQAFSAKNGPYVIPGQTGSGDYYYTFAPNQGPVPSTSDSIVGNTLEDVGPFKREAGEYTITIADNVDVLVMHGFNAKLNRHTVPVGEFYDAFGEDVAEGSVILRDAYVHDPDAWYVQVVVNVDDDYDGNVYSNQGVNAGKSFTSGPVESFHGEGWTEIVRTGKMTKAEAEALAASLTKGASYKVNMLKTGDIVNDPDDIMKTFVSISEPVVVKLTTAAHNVKAGDYFTMNATFTEKQSSNAAILTYTFDGDKFEYANFTPAEGVQVVNTEYEKGSAKITLISMNYDMETFGDIMLRAKEGAELAREFQTVSLTADYVVKDEDGNKEILTAGASARFTTLGNGTIEPVEPGDTNDDGVVDLIDLSNMIDWFGTTSGDADWETLYTFFDFNNNGEIDINDISYVARLIK